MSRLAVFTARGAMPAALRPPVGRLIVGDPIPAAPPCDRCPDRANVELTRDSGRVSAYCVPCLVELAGFGADLEYGG